MKRSNQILIALGLMLFAIFFALFVWPIFQGNGVINPVFLHLGALELRWYGLLISVAILISYFLAERDFVTSGGKENQFDASILLVLAFGLIGARLGFVIQNTAYYGSHFGEVFKIWDGGLSIHGALILGILAIWLSTKWFKVDFWKLANAITPYTLLSGAIGRWGNFFNQEIIGKPTNYFLKMFVSPENRPLGYLDNSFFHPVFLYESVFLMLAFVIYQVFLKKYKLGFVYTLIVYSFIRIVVEPFRADYKPIFWIFDLAQLVSLAIIIFTLLSFWISAKNASGLSRSKK